MPRIRSLVRILEVDSELARGVPRGDLAVASARLVCPLRELAPGNYRPAEIPGIQLANVVGLVLLEGRIARRVQVLNAASAELFGEGDFICSSAAAESFDDEDESYTVLDRSRLALIDYDFLIATGRWPEIAANIVSRLAAQNYRARLLHAIGNIVGVDQRVLATLWYFTERWGRVVSTGVSVRLSITNEMMGNIVGASAPSVSTAISKLIREQAIIDRRPDGTWLLNTAYRPGPPAWAPQAAASRAG